MPSTSCRARSLALVVVLATRGPAAFAQDRPAPPADPTGPAADAPVPVEELRLSEVWSGEAVLIRANRGYSETDAPFSLRWLVGLVLQEKKALRDIGIASMCLSVLAIFPMLIVMSAMDKVLAG